MKYVIGRNNLSCTVFVPFDCDNNCPFCTSKSMYNNGMQLNPQEIINKINILNGNADIKEYVLTGGEPFANLGITKTLINAMEKRCFINTTLPMNDNIDEIVDYINNEPKIQGINISRHIGFNFKMVAGIDIINRIKKPIRINTVINKNFTFDKFKEFVKEWGDRNRMINLRADYTTLDTCTLKSRDVIEELLATEYMYRGGGGCLVCFSCMFEADNCNIQYHRGLMYSSVRMGEKTYINDVIITPDGNMYKDWDMKTDENFNAWILKIPNCKETEIVVEVDWLNDGNVIKYYYQNTSKENISITEHREKSKKLYNKEQIEETIDELKHQLNKSLVNIYTL